MKKLIASLLIGPALIVLVLGVFRASAFQPLAPAQTTPVTVHRVDAFCDPETSGQDFYPIIRIGHYTQSGQPQIRRRSDGG